MTDAVIEIIAPDDVADGLAIIEQPWSAGPAVVANRAVGIGEDDIVLEREDTG
jgi:hypothetical protein